MKPYYQDQQVTLYHGDCGAILPRLRADVVVSDPPYGVGMSSFTDELDLAITGVAESPGKRAAVFVSPRTVLEFAKQIQWQVGAWQPERLLWMHKAADMAAPWRGWNMNSEAILVMSRTRDGWPKATDYHSDVYRVGPWERTGHPCGKPLAVVADLVRRLCNPSDVVLDPFAGSGTTLVAAKAQGISAVGIEIEERYCEIAARRLSQDVLDFGDGVA